ncbi:MAG: hypothetical protein LUG18_06490 [Candidatus Azobacteroides sp.]|nr:hypothetical protein [Candidatus Azobacteroides sp.]
MKITGIFLPFCVFILLSFFQLSCTEKESNLREIELSHVSLEIPLFLSDAETVPAGFSPFYGEVLSFYIQQSLFSELDKYRNQPIELFVKELFITIMDNEGEIKETTINFASRTYINDELFADFELPEQTRLEDYSDSSFISYFQDICDFVQEGKSLQLTFSGLTELLSDEDEESKQIGIMKIEPVIIATVDLKGFIEKENAIDTPAFGLISY